MTKAQEQAKQEAIEHLKTVVKPGDTVYTILRSVSRSGMSRTVSAMVHLPDGPFDISGWAAKATGLTLDRDRLGVKMQGCGTDMGFELVYQLAWALFREGFGCVGEGCPSNDHSNGDRDYTPHMTDAERTGADGTLCTCHKEHMHSDPGYSLRQRWL
jgi:hypothetical protein